MEERLAYEQDVIEQMGFVPYFLITQDFVAFARREGIPVGPGRGSAAGSIVAYALGITSVAVILPSAFRAARLDPVAALRR